MALFQQVFPSPDAKADVHITPVGDLREHDYRTRACWCNPHVATTDPETGAPYPRGKAVVVHNSADGRELVERHGVN